MWRGRLGFGLANRELVHELNVAFHPTMLKAMIMVGEGLDKEKKTRPLYVRVRSGGPWLSIYLWLLSLYKHVRISIALPYWAYISLMHTLPEIKMRTPVTAMKNQGRMSDGLFLFGWVCSFSSCTSLSYSPGCDGKSVAFSDSPQSLSERYTAPSSLGSCWVIKIFCYRPHEQSQKGMGT